MKYALRFLLAHLSKLARSPAGIIENVGANIQGNTMAPTQSAQHGGTLVGCGGQTCMHHSGGSVCNDHLAIVGTQHSGGLVDKDKNGKTEVQDRAMVPKVLQIVMGLMDGLAQECVNHVVVSRRGHLPQFATGQPIEAQG
jgi:hypothetical protein